MLMDGRATLAELIAAQALIELQGQQPIDYNKTYLQELKIILERQDQQVKNVVSLCVNTVKEMKSGTLYLASQSIQQPIQNPTISGPPHSHGNISLGSIDSDQEANDTRFHKTSAQPNLQYIDDQSSKAVKSNWSAGNHSKRHYRRPLDSSTPLPGRCNENIKVTFDQSTQTDMYNPLSKIEEIEATLKILYKQYLNLVAQVYENDGISVLSEVSDLEQYLSDQTASETPATGEASTGQPTVNTSNIVNDDNPVEPISMEPKPLHVRRASAHTTNDMVPIGSGNALVPTRLLADLDWTSYTSATRQLLQAVFPRRVLATHSLSGKQSPAFANKPPKKRLDPRLVDDIVDTVSKRCGVHKRLVRNCITIKCTDEAKLYKNRQTFKRMREMNQNQENLPPSSASSSAS